MATAIGARVQGPGCARRSAECDAPPVPALLAAALVSSLEQAVVAARCLLVAMATGGACPMDADGSEQTFAGPEATAGGGDSERATTVEACVIPEGLSCREREVLGLLAAGHSNRQIAQSLFLSPRTVQRHVANAYLKIGAHNKAAATAYALRHDLR